MSRLRRWLFGILLVRDLDIYLLGSRQSSTLMMSLGSLGIPRVPWLGKIGFPKDEKEYAFDNTNVGEHVENAFQALGLDEHREPFTPSVWEKTRGSRTVRLPVER